ncbi:MAG: hypothetical protein KDF24_04070 [Rhodocyclaceae bacterium]|nr:hypothetical protein [Rhodocyclaceae bacterium]MCB1962330.1 hypothetical protein [Rhodocyclaceae bacterium]
MSMQTVPRPRRPASPAAARIIVPPHAIAVTACAIADDNAAMSAAGPHARVETCFNPLCVESARPLHPCAGECHKIAGAGAWRFAHSVLRRFQTNNNSFDTRHHGAES